MNILQILWQLVLAGGQLLVETFSLALQWLPLIAWVAWWTFGVNWRKTREALKQGAWAPLVLLMLLVALVWSQLAPSSWSWQTITLPNFWWQLGVVTIIVGLTFLCGAVQDAAGWTPPEINLDPPTDSGVEHRHP